MCANAFLVVYRRSLVTLVFLHRGPKHVSDGVWPHRFATQFAHPSARSKRSKFWGWGKPKRHSASNDLRPRAQLTTMQSTQRSNN